jgi:hypothetical protein
MNHRVDISNAHGHSTAPHETNDASFPRQTKRSKSYFAASDHMLYSTKTAGRRLTRSRCAPDVSAEFYRQSSRRCGLP